MSTNDLFSFLDETPADNAEDTNIDNDSMQTDRPLSPKRISHKRKADDPPRADNLPQQNGPLNGDDHTEDDENAVMQDTDGEPGPSVPKKLRVEAPNPVVLDDFETEAKREVAASAGLTGGVEAGSRLELKHQVRPYNYLPHPMLHASCNVGAASGCSAPRA